MPGNSSRTDKYAELGVDSRKGAYGKLFTSVAQEAFPHAFCKIYIDPVTGLATSQHGDGVGSKSVQRYLDWLVRKDSSVFEGDSDDCLEMNLGDIACSGLKPVMFTDNIAINKRRLPKEMYLQAVNKRMGELLELYASHGMPFIFAGGETADLPDQARTVIFDGTITARAPKERVVTCEKIAPGDIIVGIMSGGYCRLEGDGKVLNSGIMSNGSTLARHCLMHRSYGEMHPEIMDDGGKGYTGRCDVFDAMFDGMRVSEAIISPTRHFSIIVNSLLEKHGEHVHGLVLNTGGGQTKCTRVGKGIKYVKDSLPKPDPIFMAIAEAAGETPQNMHQTFNMGIGVDVIGPPGILGMVEEVAGGEFGVGFQKTGYCVDGHGRNSLVIVKDGQELTYGTE